MNKKASEARRKACVKKLVDNYELAPISEGTETQNDPENEDCCDICFMFYHGGVNLTKCCKKQICTKCLLQSCPTLVNGDNNINCIFCTVSGLKTEYKGPLGNKKLQAHIESYKKDHHSSIIMLDDDDDDDDKKEDDDDNTGSARSGAPFMLTMNSSLRATRCVPPAYPPLCLPQSASGINSYVIEGMSEEEMINMAIQMSVKDQNRVQQSPHVPQVPHGPPPPQPRRRKRRAAFIKCQRQLNNMLAPQSPELPHAERRSYHNTNEDDEDDEDDDDDSRNDSDNLLSAFGRHVEPSYVPAQQQQPMRPFVTPLPPPPPPPPLQQPYQQQIFCHQSTSLFTPQQPPQLAQSSSPLMLFGPKQSSPQSGASVMPKVQQWPHQQPQQRVMWSQDTSAVFQPPQTPIFAQASFLHQRSLPQQQLFAARTPPQQQHHHQQQPPQTPLFAARTPPQQQQHHQQRLPQQRLFAARTPPQPPVQFSQGVFSTQQKFRPSVPPSGAPMFQAPLFQTSSQQQQQQQQQQRYSSMLFMNQQLSQEFRPSPTLPQYKAAPSCIQHSQQPGHSLF